MIDTVRDAIEPSIPSIITSCYNICSRSSSSPAMLVGGRSVTRHSSLYLRHGTLISFITRLPHRTILEPLLFIQYIIELMEGQWNVTVFVSMTRKSAALADIAASTRFYIRSLQIVAMQLDTVEQASGELIKD